MPRYALKIEYHGGTFAGWQRQKGLATVQGTIEQALRKLEPIEGIAAAGRTDAGVHALAQVAHVDLAKGWEPFRLCEALNFHLKPRPIAVLAVARVAVDFHARFSATGRAYRYRLISRRAPLTCDAGLAWRVAPELNLAAMQAGGKHLVGFHDFTTFRSTDCQAASPEKTLDDLRIEVRDVPHGQEFIFMSGHAVSAQSGSQFRRNARASWCRCVVSGRREISS